MRILIPTVDYPPIEGGISTVTLEVSRTLASLGHEVWVVAPRSGEAGQVHRALEAFDEGEPLHVVRYGGYWLRWGRVLPLFFKAWPLVRNVDLVLGMNVSYGGILGRLAHAVSGKRYIAFAYAYEFKKFARTPLVGRLLRSVYANAAAVVAISRYTAENLKQFGVAPDQITLAFPGAPKARDVSDEEIRRVRLELGLGEGSFILAVGRFVPRKGHLTLIEAMPRIAEAFPDVALVMAGRGPLQAACLAKADALGIRSCVHCPGYVDDAALDALYAGCTLFALPTGADARGHVEGFGLVFAEAHAYGKPVVGGRSGGVVDAVIEGETGFLVSPEDPAALAEAILKLLAEPDYAARLGAQGRRRVAEELNWQVFTERVLEAVS